MSSTPPPSSPSKSSKKPSTETPKTPSQRRSQSHGNKSSPNPPADAAKSTSDTTTPDKKSSQQQRRGDGQAKTGGGGHDRRHSASGATRPASIQTPQSSSEGMANLQNLISELKDAPATTGSPGASSNLAPAPSQSPSRQSPARHRQSGQHARKASAGSHQAPSFNGLQQQQQQAVPPVALNPNAGGFQPGMLGPISDRTDEALITPTASHFDLMTGMPRSPPGLSNLRQQSGDFGNASAQPGIVGGFSSPQQSLAQQQHFIQLQQQQQAFQMQQLANMGAFVGPGSPTSGPAQPRDEAAELMAEQLAIQQQLASLRIQQENLLARFGDMQASAGLGAADGPQESPQQQASATRQQHRRVNSQQQIGGTMGQFGLNTSGPMGSFSAGSATGSAGGLPKGHGRRHSVNTSKSGQTSIGSLNPAFSFGAGSSSTANNLSQGSGAVPGAGLGQPAPIADNSVDFGEGGDVFTSGRRGMGHQRRTSGSMSSLGGWQAVMNQGVQANLAEAQSHLQQLAVYRASSGHARVPSFGMSTLGGGPGQLAMAGYGGGLPTPGQAGSGAQQRKSLFAPYLPQASIPPLLAAGKLVVGTLRVNKRNRSDAYVAVDSLDSDIYICGSKDRNRALEGDIVAVELLDVDEVWGTKKDKEEKKRKKEESASFDPRATRDLRKLDKKKDDVEVEGQGLLLFEEDEVNDDQKPQFAGHVVAVVERAPGQLFSGMLGVLRPSSAATQQKQDAERREREGVDLRSHDNGKNGQPPPKIIWFRPTDKRVPLIAIPTDQAPEDFIHRPDKYADRLFVSCIKRWPITSLHPFGTLVEELGVIGDIETETNALLKDCNFTAEDFSEAVVKCLPPLPYTIPEREFNEGVRRDFRGHRVFTIDPETARDLDDALHIVPNDDGTFEVGVHIADVSHFVKPNTALDREARKRATTVYLTQRAVPMLPQALSETLCSLTPGQDKLTFSVVFTLSPDGRILSTWFGKTVINSSVKLAYSDAQEVIEGRPLPAHRLEAHENERDEVEKSIQMLASIARHLRKRRFENGALRIDNVKVNFQLDENGVPEDCSMFEPKEANELIEEFMLMANMAVAGKIAAGLPEQALLRRHEPPIDRRLDAFLKRMGRLGLKLDGGSAGALMNSIKSVDDENSRTTLQHLSTKSMLRAKYFCTGMLDISKYAHYALNVPLYTHFTSPIRRYADVIVHRQLEAVLSQNNDVKFNLDSEMVAKVAANCNTKRDAAKLAQEQSAHLFLCVLISELTRMYGPVVRTATVIGVLDQAFDVLIPEFGVEKRVHLDQMPTENSVHDEDTNALSIYWKKGVDVLRWLAESNGDAHLQRVRDHADHHARLLEATSADAGAEKALFEDDEEDDEEREARKAREAKIKMTTQRLKSKDKKKRVFEGLESKDGHSIQTVKELQDVPVIVTADLTKSPPVIKVLAVNPYA